MTAWAGLWIGLGIAVGVSIAGIFVAAIIDSAVKRVVDRWWAIERRKFPAASEEELLAALATVRGEPTLAKSHYPL